MAPPLPRRAAALALLCAMAVALAGCLLTPGRFTANLDLRRSGQFTLTYAGEIHLLALSKLAEAGGSAGEDFIPQPCLDSETGSSRECRPAEIADQRQEWKARSEAAAERRRKDAEQMKAFLGGIDPSSPQAAEDFAQRLRRQAGWRKVEYKGDGLFVVDFALSGQLSHDLAFPTIERFPMANPFIQASLRQDGTVRIDAPGFAPASSGEPWRMMMGGIAGPRDPEAGEGPKLPVIEGIFTITTDGEVLANNTDEGPQAMTTGRQLTWPVSLRSPAPPMALIRLRN